MRAMENAAFISVGRACGFAGLGLFCLIFGLSYDPVLAARAGGVLTLGLAVILAGFAMAAPTRPYKRTELWLILAKDDRPAEPAAQMVIGAVLRRTYLWFAKKALLIAVVLLVVSVPLGFLPVDGS